MNYDKWINDVTRYFNLDIIYRGEIGGRGCEATKGNGDGLYWAEEGFGGGKVDKEESGAMAVRSIHNGGESVHISSIWQESTTEHGSESPWHSFR